MIDERAEKDYADLNDRVLEIDGEDDDDDHNTEEEKDLVMDDASEMMLGGSIIGGGDFRNSSFRGMNRSPSPNMALAKLNLTPA